MKNDSNFQKFQMLLLLQIELFSTLYFVAQSPSKSYTMEFFLIVKNRILLDNFIANNPYLFSMKI